jgi:hypothetical protein
MDAKPCPSNKADYVLKSLVVERIDFVEEGGCESCVVGAKPEGMILTAKLSIKGKDNGDEIMDAVDEAIPKEEVEESPVESVDAESEVTVEATEEVDAKTEEPEKEVEDEEVVAVVDDEPDKIAELEKKIEEMQKELGSKKAPVEAFNAEEEITNLIKAGKALPKMKASLLKVAENPEAFKLLVASLPKMVQMETKAKLAKIEKQTKKPDKPKTWDEEYGDLAKHFRV